MNKPQSTNSNTSQEKSENKPPLLPRRGWEDDRAFLNVMNRTKILLEISEIESLLTDISRDRQD
ncbi:MAG: hypothetical protein AAF383_15535 [Cyanobacteria bacterium P01_A01_bin.83]